jgi:hypothetical protein
MPLSAVLSKLECPPIESPFRRTTSLQKKMSAIRVTGLGAFSLLGECWIIAFFKIQESPLFLDYCFPLQKFCINFDKNWVKLLLGRFFDMSPCTGATFPALGRFVPGLFVPGGANIRPIWNKCYLTCPMEPTQSGTGSSPNGCGNRQLILLGWPDWATVYFGQLVTK